MLLTLEYPALRIVSNFATLQVEMQSRNEMIAHLKDQLQETRAKTTMERKYIEKECQVLQKYQGSWYALVWWLMWINLYLIMELSFLQK